jgi:hypothetical protein
MAFRVIERKYLWDKQGYFYQAPRPNTPESQSLSGSVSGIAVFGEGLAGKQEYNRRQRMQYKIIDRIANGARRHML